MSFRLILASTFFVIFAAPTLSQATQTEDQQGTASLLVLLDLSSSMRRHHQKLSELAPIVQQAMENSRCEFKVAVAGIAYKGMTRPSHFLPWAEPGGDPWITQDTPNGPEIIRERIAYPREIINPNYDGDQNQGAPYNNNETTYSSIADSLRANWANLENSWVIGTILLTDAVPAFETRSPEQAVLEIEERLSGIPYLAANIVAQVSNASDIQPPSVCGPDHTGYQVTGERIRTEEWDTPYPNAINEFNQLIYGSQWDICESTYDVQLRAFINSVLMVGGCLPIS